MVNLLENKMIQDNIRRIRTEGIKNRNFRHGVTKLGEYMAYEFADTLDKEEVKIQTPLGIADGITLENEKIVIVTLLRASLPLAMGVLNVFDEAKFGVVGAWREEEPPFNVIMDYMKLPDLTDTTVIIPDPMLATGNTIDLFLNKMKAYGKPKRIAMFSLISAPEGIERIEKAHPEVEIYTCAIDEKIDENGYIVPGLGDAGDLAFGEPLDI